MQANAWTTALAAADAGQLAHRVAPLLGFGASTPTDESTRRLLGLPDDVRDARLAPGGGTTRLLVAEVHGRSSTRELTVRVAARLSRKAPHLTWLVALLIPDRDEFVIAAWNVTGTGVRVSALVSRTGALSESDIETLAALQGAMSGPDLLVHQRWVEILGREAITRRFFIAVRETVKSLAEGASGPSDTSIRHEFAMLHVSRLLFLGFLEARGWLDDDRRFLAREYDAAIATCPTGPHRFQRCVLEPLFFGTLNTPVRRRAARARAFGRIPFLNGGLFTRTGVESRHRDLRLSDHDWGIALDRLLLRYRFTTREEASDWQEAAVDPEVLGRAFESLMASPTRRATGVFYTPFVLVERVADAALRSALASRGIGNADSLLAGGPAPPDERPALLAVLQGLRILDPSCGSGAFLVHLVDRLAALRAAAGEELPRTAIRRDVVSHQVFGVDVNPTAVWLCELRLWLALVVDHPASDASSVPPLPNLDHNIRCGDTLDGGAFASRATQDRGASQLRARYARATGSRKRTLARLLVATERRRAVAFLDEQLMDVASRRCELLAAARGRDLFGARRGSVATEAGEKGRLRALSRRLRSQRAAVAGGGALPFSFAAHFPDAAGQGGFDLVIGNPPWIRLHRMPLDQRLRWRREFRVFREAAWTAGARAARAGTGFASQVDAASLFIERSHQLAREGGIVALVVPAKLWRSLAGGGVRRLLTDRARLLVIEDWSAAPAMFDAATYPSIVVARKDAAGDMPDVQLSVQRGTVDVSWRLALESLPLDTTPGAPWLLLPPEARRVFDRVAGAGVPLSDAGLGVATMGVKCGCNEAFVVRAVSSGARMEVTDGSRTAVLDRDHVRPLLRGEAVRAWRPATSDAHLVFPYTRDGRAMMDLPPDVRAWLWPWRSRLRLRSDARGSRTWWSLFRLDGARTEWPRVVWADIGRSLQALVLHAGDRTVPLNTCYVLPVRDEVDALTLAAYLNSPLANAWVGSVAEPARGGYRRHFAWTLARLPVPDDWGRAREILAPLGERGIRGAPPGRSDLLGATAEAFRMRPHALAPLVEWNHT